jgi:hypothetical protein
MTDWKHQIIAAQEERTYEIAGQSYFRIPWGEEDVEAAIIAQQHPCHDCTVPAGQLHVPGCDQERCPRCTQQAIACLCHTQEQLSDDNDGPPWEQIIDAPEVEDRPWWSLW